MGLFEFGLVSNSKRENIINNFIFTANSRISLFMLFTEKISRTLYIGGTNYIKKT